MAGDPGTVGEILAGVMAGNMSGNTSADTSGNSGLSEEIARLAEELRQLQTVTQAATESSRASLRVTGNGDSPGGSIGKTLLGVLGAGPRLSPLLSGIASLFGGSGDNSTPGSAATPLARFELPPSLQVNAGVRESGGQAFAVEHPQGGLPRGVRSVAPAQITVQVQAMDSRSFLDHSADIAMAVRQAMLESSVLNDVVREA
jgi:hypothetical protein